MNRVSQGPVIIIDWEKGRWGGGGEGGFEGFWFFQNEIYLILM